MFNRTKKTLCFLLLIVTLVSLFSVTAVAQPLTIDNDTKEAIYNDLRNGIKAGLSEIDLSTYSIPRNDMDNILNSFIWENPDVSFCITAKSFKHAYGIVHSVGFTYDNTSTISSRIVYLNEETDRIVSLMNPDWTDLQKLLWINDYLCDNFQYDLTTEYHSAVDLIRTGKGICEAYTNLFTILCQKNGIDVSYCYSTEINHIWNMVKLNDQWYHVDSTWNDTYTDRYEHFLLSDSECKKAIKESGYNQTFTLNSLYTASSNKYDNAFWRKEIYSSIVNLGTDTYYVKNFALYKANLETMQSSLIAKLNETKWTAPGGSYSDGFNDLEVIGDSLYYNTPNEIFQYKPSSKTFTSVYKNSNSQIVSIRMTDSGMRVGQNNDLNKDVVSFANIYLKDVFTVKYYLDNTLFYIQFYDKGDLINLPSTGRTDKLSGIQWNDVEPGTKVLQHASIYGKSLYNNDAYTIKFLINGKLYETITVKPGQKITAPKNPEKESDAYNHYVFIKWIGFEPDMRATGNMSFNAEFKEIKRTYTIKFYNDTTLLSEQKLDAGAAITFPTAAQQITKDGKTYQFVGWSTSETLALSNMNIYTVYAESGKMCKIVYYNDGIVFFEQTVAAGTRLNFIAQMPTKPGSGFTGYKFIKWVGQEENTFVLNDIILHAEYEEVVLDTPAPTEPTTQRGFFDKIDVTLVIIIAILILVVIGSWFVLFKRKD